MNTAQLKKYIIVPTLKDMDLYSEAAVNLLLGTCAQESGMGEWIHQVDGSALGIYQMEELTFYDIRERFLFKSNSYFQMKFEDCCKLYVSNCQFEHLIWNLKFATIMTRLKYWSISEPLPDANDIEAQARYWKQYYNTPSGKGTTKQFIDNGKKHKVY